mgnify:CR=1 FL=1
METLDALYLAHDFEKGQIQRSINILQSVVVMHMQIARTFHDQGTTRMLGESMEHAIKEAGLGLNICNCRHQTLPLIFQKTSSMALSGASFYTRVRKTYTKEGKVFRAGAERARQN